MRAIGAGLIAVVVALVVVQRSVHVYPRQKPGHWINLPSSLRQMNDDETELNVMGAAVTNVVWLGAFTSSQPVNGCDWWYRLEVEVRIAGEAFRFEPTHVGGWIPRSYSRQSLAYPLVRVSGLRSATAYRWIARERVQPFTEFSEPGQVMRCEPGALRSSDWTWHHVPFDFSFRTPFMPSSRFLLAPSEDARPETFSRALARRHDFLLWLARAFDRGGRPRFVIRDRGPRRGFQQGPYSR